MPVKPKSEWLTTQQAAAYLRVSEEHFYRLVHNYGLPACRLGRTFRIYRPALDEWLLARPAVPVPANGEEPMDQGGTHGVHTRAGRDGRARTTGG